MKAYWRFSHVLEATANLQRDGAVPSPESIMHIVESPIAAAAQNGCADHTIFLATDDSDAVDAFRRAFPSYSFRMVFSARQPM